MKKIFYILSAALVFLTSCSLTEESKVEMEMGKYVRNAAEAEQVLLGVYQSMTAQSLWGYHLSLLFPLGTDLAQVEGTVTSYPREIPTNFHNASTKEIAQTWNTLYNAVYNANSFIETVTSKMQGWSAGDRQLAECYLAEARALRALYYFELVRWFGNIALVTSTAESYMPNDYFVQAPPEEVYAIIEADLKYAADVLPWATDDHIRASNAYRFSKGGALGLLTKVYCTWAGYPLRDQTKWAEAVRAAKPLVESGRHHLLADYRKLWENAGASAWDPAESLIEVSFYWSTKTGSEPVGYIGKWNGVITSQVGDRGTCQARQRIVYPFALDWQTKKDPRYDCSVAEYRYGYTSSDWTYNGVTYSKKNGNALFETDGRVGLREALEVVAARKAAISGKTSSVDENAVNKQLAANCTPAKWDIEQYAKGNPLYSQNYNSTVNWYLLRYSDVLLLYAEALNESQGPTDEAHAALNAVRRRAFGDAKHDLSGLSQEGLRQAIRRERAWELCFEGHRKFDLIRWGVYYDTIMQTAQQVVDWFTDARYIVADYTQRGKHELMPIPQTQKDILPNFKQNPGWGK